MRLFNALNGAEVKAIILHEIAEELDQNEDFAKHITFPLIEWDWKVNVKAHAQEIGEITAEGGGAVKVRQAEPVAMLLSGGRSVMKSEERPYSQAPDEARRAAGLPVSAVQEGPLGAFEQPETPAESANSAIDALLQRRSRKPGRPPGPPAAP